MFVTAKKPEHVGRNLTKRCTLTAPRHWLEPEDFLTFIELHGFEEDWRDLGLTDDDLTILQGMIMAQPKAHPVIAGSGGLRKMSFAPTGWNQGKRGAVRICYVYFQEHEVVLLTVVYSKREQGDLTKEEKAAIKSLIHKIDKDLSRQRGK